MTAMPRDVTRKRPANLPVQRRVVEGRVSAPRDTPTVRVINAIVLLLLAAFFAGLLLSTV